MSVNLDAMKECYYIHMKAANGLKHVIYPRCIYRTIKHSDRASIKQLIQLLQRDFIRCCLDSDLEIVKTVVLLSTGVHMLCIDATYLLDLFQDGGARWLRHNP